MPKISSANRGRSFEVLTGSLGGHWDRGSIFTEFDFRRKYPPPAPHAGLDPEDAAEAYYQEMLDRLLNGQNPAIRVIHTSPAYAINPELPTNNIGSTFAPPTQPLKPIAASVSVLPYKPDLMKKLDETLAQSFELQLDAGSTATDPALKSKHSSKLWYVITWPKHLWIYAEGHNIWNKVVGGLITAAILSLIGFAWHKGWLAPSSSVPSTTQQATRAT